MVFGEDWVNNSNAFIPDGASYVGAKSKIEITKIFDNIDDPIFAIKYDYWDWIPQDKEFSKESTQKDLMYNCKKTPEEINADFPNGVNKSFDYVLTPVYEFLTSLNWAEYWHNEQSFWYGSPCIEYKRENFDNNDYEEYYVNWVYNEGTGWLSHFSIYIKIEPEKNEIHKYSIYSIEVSEIKEENKKEPIWEFKLNIMIITLTLLGVGSSLMILGIKNRF